MSEPDVPFVEFVARNLVHQWQQARNFSVGSLSS